uniref:glutathione transferase n=1 Tax=Kalanchoe fedtschenkoi TaxID=63787 RepID=A0A7N0V5W0_KALFE
MPLDLQGRVSHIHFGDRSAVGEARTVTVPLVPGRPGNFYHVTLEAFTVGRTQIPFTSRSGAIEQGNIIIDSETALTTLPRHFYAQIKKVVTTQTHELKVPDPYRLLELCFRKDRSLQLPSIVANFRGSNMLLKQFNTFVTLGSATCLAFGVSESFFAYGSLAQQNFLVGFDQNARTMSFKLFQCSHSQKVKLFRTWSCPFALRIVWALKLKGVEYETILEDLTNKSPSLLQYNPIHKKVPVLVHGGNTMVESLVILEYIDETWAEGYRLLLKDPYERSVARWLEKGYEGFSGAGLRVGMESVHQAEKEQEEALVLALNHLKFVEEYIKGKRTFGGDEIGFTDLVFGCLANLLSILEESAEVKILDPQTFHRC